MAKKKEYQESLFDFVENEKIQIPNPLCIRIRHENRGFQSSTTYYRYIEDGRYEMISTSKTVTSIQYGNWYDYNSKEKEQRYLKVLFYRAKESMGGQSVITNEEFEEAKQIYMIDNYKEYLEGVDKTEFKEAKIQEENNEPFFLSKPEEDAPF